MKRRGYAVPKAADVSLAGGNEPSIPLAVTGVPRIIGNRKTIQEALFQPL